MFDKVKNALRIKTDAFNDEITDLITAAKADMGLVGINVTEPAEGEEDDPLLLRAVILYAKAHFGLNTEGERYEKAYEHLKCSLSLAGDYNGVE